MCIFPAIQTMRARSQVCLVGGSSLLDFNKKIDLLRPGTLTSADLEAGEHLQSFGTSVQLHFHCRPTAQQLSFWLLGAIVMDEPGRRPSTLPTALCLPSLWQLCQRQGSDCCTLLTHETAWLPARERCRWEPT